MRGTCQRQEVLWKRPCKSAAKLSTQNAIASPSPRTYRRSGVEKGKEGVIHNLDYHNETVYASVLVTYSTNQPRGWVDVQVAPREKVSSYTTIL